MRSRYVINVGDKFERLTVVSRLGGKLGGRWECRCECGKRLELTASHLATGNNMSCGCLRTERRRLAKLTHGMSRSPEWNTWRAMVGRCTYEKNEKYHLYGGKGIKVHPAWLKFEGFIKDVGLKPTSKHSLDRYPNPAGNYEPGNVRWATQTQQCRNLRDQKRYTAFGKTLCMSEWAEEVGMSVQTLSWRLHSEKQPIEQALRPVMKRTL